jgi:hypothetical protein
LHSVQQLVTDNERVRIALHWEALAGIAEPLRFSLRLVDADGHRWGQRDTQPVDGFFPTTLWHAGQGVTERHDLRPLPGTPPGKYQLELVVYSLSSGQELQLQTGGIVGKLGELELARTEEVRRAVDIPQKRDLLVADGLILAGIAPMWTETQAGDRLPVTFFWRASGTTAADYQVALEVVGPAGEIWGSYEGPVANQWYPTGHWNENETLRAQYTVPVGPQAVPGKAMLRLSILDGGKPVSGEKITVGELDVRGRERNFTAPNIQNIINSRLGNAVRLLGYGITSSTFSPNQRLPLTLYWQAEATMDTSYTVFVQILGPDGRLWGQQDSLPGQGKLPTTGWVKGEVLLDDYSISINPTTPPGTYTVIAGMYDARTGQRLAVTDASGDSSKDFATLSRIVVEASP